MNSSTVALLTDRFASLMDPRTGRAKRYKLIDVIVIAICAVICGADSWVDVEMFGKSKKDWLSRLLELPNGIPSHDTFGRVFARLDPVQFVDITLAIPIEDDSSDPDYIDPESPHPESVAVASQEPSP